MAPGDEGMAMLRNKALVVALAALAMAAVFGGSLGVAFAGQKSTLTSGINPTVGGPLFGDVVPEKFMSCLPVGSWTAVYLWDSNTQSWRHYFNTNGTGVPAYVNNAAVGGLAVVPRLAGLAVIMNQGVQSPFFPDRQSDICP